MAAVEARLAEAQAAFDAEAAALAATVEPATLPLDELRIAPRKGDLAVTRLAVAWVPHRLRPDGRDEAGA
ncbi:MAG: hypothetical protein KIT14_07835 [bacterium]|nr:hypothetical protein [bacterium]